MQQTFQKWFDRDIKDAKTALAEKRILDAADSLDLAKIWLEKLNKCQD